MSETAIEENIKYRLNAWKKLIKDCNDGFSKTLDLYQFHKEIGETDLFEGERPKTQATWRRLIRYIYTYEKGIKPDLEQVRDFQKNQLGRKKQPGIENSEIKTCILELLPLPSPRADNWFYKKPLSDLPELQSREKYKSEILQFRIKEIKNLIGVCKPSRV